MKTILSTLLIFASLALNAAVPPYVRDELWTFSLTTAGLTATSQIGTVEVLN